MSGNRNLENYHRFKSDYGKNTSEGTKVGDYVVPSSDANLLRKYFNYINNWYCVVGYDLGNDPTLYQHTRRAKYDATKSGEFKKQLTEGARQ